jgi:hypothetical protein
MIISNLSFASRRAHLSRCVLLGDSEHFNNILRAAVLESFKVRATELRRRVLDEGVMRDRFVLPGVLRARCNDRMVSKYTKRRIYAAYYLPGVSPAASWSASSSSGSMSLVPGVGERSCCRLMRAFPPRRRAAARPPRGWLGWTTRALRPRRGSVEGGGGLLGTDGAPPMLASAPISLLSPVSPRSLQRALLAARRFLLRACARRAETDLERERLRDSSSKYRFS